MARYSVPSALFFMSIFEIPSNGATKMPSVNIAKPTLMDMSRAFFLSSESLLAISLAVIMLTVSLSYFAENSLIISATPLKPINCSTLDARSSAFGISIKSSGSNPLDLAISATL